MDASAIAATASLSSTMADPSLRGAHTPAQQRKAVAGQFEAILMRQFLSQSVGDMLGGEDSMAGSVYGYMLTDCLASKLTQSGGMGLSKVIEAQLKGPNGVAPPDSTTTPAAQLKSPNGVSAPDSTTAATPAAQLKAKS